MERLAIEGGRPVRKEMPNIDPVPSKSEIDAVASCLKEGYVSDFLGKKKVKEFEEKIASFTELPYSTAFNSGTAALHVSLDLLGVGFKDQVIVPAYTWVTVATTVLQQTALPVFADISEDDFGINAGDLASRINRHTKAIILCHLYGIGAEINEVRKIAKESGIAVIEDCSQAFGVKIGKKHVGSFGDIGCFSFQLNKNITSGEGGMLVTKNRRFWQESKIIRQGGKATRTSFSRIGYNYRMPDICAAIGIAQLSTFGKMNKKRIKNTKRYLKRLKGTGLKFPKKIDLDKGSYTKVPVLFPRELKEKRNRFVKTVLAENVPIEPGYSTPLYKIPYIRKKDFFGKRFQKAMRGMDYKKCFCQTAEDACERTINLISTHYLEENVIDDACEAIKKVLNNL